MTAACSSAWQSRAGKSLAVSVFAEAATRKLDGLETFRNSLAVLKTAGIAFDGLDAGLELLQRLLDEFGALGLIR
jgi:hypothetical protein